MGKFFYQSVLCLIRSFLATSFSLRRKCDQKTMLLLSRKASAVSSSHLSNSGMPCLPFQPPLPITWGLATSPGMALREVQKGKRHLNSFYLPLVSSEPKHHQDPQAGTTLQGWKTENRCSHETDHLIQGHFRTYLLVRNMLHSKLWFSFCMQKPLIFGY